MNKVKWFLVVILAWSVLALGLAFAEESTTPTVPTVADSIDVVVKRTQGRELSFLAETMLVIDSISTVTIDSKIVTLPVSMKSESKTRIVVWLAVSRGDIKYVYERGTALDRLFIRLAARRLRDRAIVSARTKIDEITSSTLGLTNSD